MKLITPKILEGSFINFFPLITFLIPSEIFSDDFESPDVLIFFKPAKNQN